MYLLILILLIDNEAMHKFSNLGTGQSPKMIISWADGDDDNTLFFKNQVLQRFFKSLNFIYIYNIYNIYI